MRVARTLAGTKYNTIKEPRLGIMLHYDESSSDGGAVAWFTDPACQVSYNYLILDNGDVVQITPPNARAWHAGACKTSSPKLQYRDANSAFYGVAAATNSKTLATPKQKAAIVEVCRFLFQMHGWAHDETWRIVGHDTEAWERGRKIDPTGKDKGKPILSVTEIRSLL